MRGIKELSGVVVGVLALVTAANAGVYGTVWIEVDNSVGVIGEAAGVPTGLEGVRTFDLFALVTPDTDILVADFGFVASYSSRHSMWTTQEVYQNQYGGDTQSRAVGLLRSADIAALEFDTYVGLGMIDSQIVMNTNISGGDWSPSGFKAAWYVVPTGDFTVTPAVGDPNGRLFLARITVTSSRPFGDHEDVGEFLGGMVYLGGYDSRGDIGLSRVATGLFQTGNAFAGPEPAYVGSVGNGDDANDGDDDNPSDGADTGAGVDDGDGAEGVNQFTERYNGDLNADGVVDSKDMALMQGAFGTLNPVYDMNGDFLVEDRDLQMLLFLIDGTIPESAANLTPKQQRKAQKQHEKMLKNAKKQIDKEEKELRKAERKVIKALTKELKRQERQANSGG